MFSNHFTKKKNQRNFGHFFITTDKNNLRFFGSFSNTVFNLQGVPTSFGRTTPIKKQLTYDRRKPTNESVSFLGPSCPLLFLHLLWNWCDDCLHSSGHLLCGILDNGDQKDKSSPKCFSTLHFYGRLKICEKYEWGNCGQQVETFKSWETGFQEICHFPHVPNIKGYGGGVDMWFDSYWSIWSH